MNDGANPGGVGHREFLDLLGEYAGKLRHACDAYHKRRTGWSRNFTFGFLLAAFGLTGFVFFAHLPDVTGKTLASMMNIPTIMALFLIATIAGAVGFAIWQSWAETYRSRFELPPLIFALEKLVSRASQLEDRSLKDADAKIIFNLRIAEAEAALEYADWVLRSNPVLLFFRRKSLSPSTQHYRTRHVSL